jgi:hypothetical protein
MAHLWNVLPQDVSSVAAAVRQAVQAGCRAAAARLEGVDGGTGRGLHDFSCRGHYWKQVGRWRCSAGSKTTVCGAGAFLVPFGAVSGRPMQSMWTDSVAPAWL